MRIIEKVYKKIKTLVDHPWFDEFMWVSIVVSVAMGSFAFGVMYRSQQLREMFPVRVEVNQEAVALWELYQNNQQDLGFVASKNGSLVYPIGCSAANRLSESNKIFFSTVAEAESEGYRFAEGC